MSSQDVNNILTANDQLAEWLSTGRPDWAKEAAFGPAIFNFE